jgi:hypothetical protein
MPAATTAERQAMEKALASLTAQLEAAERTAAETEAQWFLTDAEKSLLKNVKDERARFETWRTTWRTWALNGTDGKDSYPVAFWLRIGGDIASALKTYSRGLYDNTAFAYVELVKQDVKEKAEAVVSPSLWPTWVKVTAGVVAVGVLFITINNIASITRSLRGA